MLEALAAAMGAPPELLAVTAQRHLAPADKPEPLAVSYKQLKQSLAKQQGWLTLAQSSWKAAWCLPTAVPPRLASLAP